MLRPWQVKEVQGVGCGVIMLMFQLFKFLIKGQQSGANLEWSFRPVSELSGPWSSQSSLFEKLKLHPQNFTSVKKAFLVFQEQGLAMMQPEIVGDFSERRMPSKKPSEYAVIDTHLDSQHWQGPGRSSGPSHHPIPPSCQTCNMPTMCSSYQWWGTCCLSRVPFSFKELTVWSIHLFFAYTEYILCTRRCSRNWAHRPERPCSYVAHSYLREIETI